MTRRESLFPALHRKGLRHLVCLLGAILWAWMAGSEIDHNGWLSFLMSLVSTAYAVPLAMQFGRDDA